jgi:hypothetical protein
MGSLKPMITTLKFQRFIWCSTPVMSVGSQLRVSRHTCQRCRFWSCWFAFGGRKSCILSFEAVQTGINAARTGGSAAAAPPVLPIAHSMSVPNKMVISSMSNPLKFCNDASDCGAYSDLVNSLWRSKYSILWFSRNWSSTYEGQKSFSLTLHQRWSQEQK